MPGMRIGQQSAMYFVLVVRPDLGGGRKDQGCQVDGDVGPAHVEEAEVPEPQEYSPGAPLIYVEIVTSKSEAGTAVKKMIAQLREELGKFPETLPTHWNVHRLHSDRGQELMDKTLNEYCLNNGIRRTTTQGYDPSANGAAEQAVGFVKRKSRHLLTGSRLSSAWWGVAAKVAAYYSRWDTGLCAWPKVPFGTRVMCVRDLVPRDAFAARSLPATIFGPSEEVPGGYIVYLDGILKNVTNIAVTDLTPHEITFVKSHVDEWQQPSGLQAPAAPEAWDAAHAPDPSIRPRGVRRRQPQEQDAPEERDPQVDPRALPDELPGEAPGDDWLKDFDQDYEEHSPGERDCCERAGEKTALATCRACQNLSQTQEKSSFWN